MKRILFALLALSIFPFLSLSGCAHQTIAGTSIIDTEENRQIVDSLKAYRDALQKLDADAIIALVSPKYFEDSGTPSPKDDYGYAEFRDQILPRSMAAADEIHLSFDIHEVIVKETIAWADIRYSSRAKLKLPAGSMWDSHQEFNRITFVLEDGKWKIISGL
ncbi:nuclear transport factor 2 family protein [Myxococcota bacterium]|nr:nuclear transport factor 2 family protein [Myxococcota bacterium]